MASSTSPTWDQEPFYQQAARRTTQAGDLAAYVDPDEEDPNLGNVTTFVVGYNASSVVGSGLKTDHNTISQANWALNNLPEILYMVDPLPSREQLKNTPLPHAKHDAQGRVVKEDWPAIGEPPRTIIDYAILPDQISSKVQWWRLEAWRRLDPRIVWADIIMRMRPEGGIRTRSLSKDTIALNGRISSKRQKFAILTWNVGQRQTIINNDQIRRRINVLGTLANANSTRGLTPGMIDPNGADIPANRVPLPTTQRPGGTGRPVIRTTTTMDIEDDDSSEGQQDYQSDNGADSEAESQLDADIGLEDDDKTPQPTASSAQRSRSSSDIPVPAYASREFTFGRPWWAGARTGELVKSTLV